MLNPFSWRQALPAKVFAAEKWRGKAVVTGRKTSWRASRQRNDTYKGNPRQGTVSGMRKGMPAEEWVR